LFYVFQADKKQDIAIPRSRSVTK